MCWDGTHTHAHTHTHTHVHPPTHTCTLIISIPPKQHVTVLFLLGRGEKWFLKTNFMDNSRMFFRGRAACNRFQLKMKDCWKNGICIFLLLVLTSKLACIFVDYCRSSHHQQLGWNKFWHVFWNLASLQTKNNMLPVGTLQKNGNQLDTNGRQTISLNLQCFLICNCI